MVLEEIYLGPKAKTTRKQNPGEPIMGAGWRVMHYLEKKDGAGGPVLSKDEECLPI